MSGNVSSENTVGWDGGRIQLSQVGGAIVVCDTDGIVVGATQLAQRLLGHAGIDAARLPRPLPPKLWHALATTPLGEAIEWRPTPSDSSSAGFLGFTRYRLGSSHVLLLMREISSKHQELSRRLHQQRLEAIGRLVAMVAHDLRAPLASIVFNVDVLANRRDCIDSDTMQQLVDELRAAAERLRWAVDGLLDFARLGPPVVMDVDVEEVFTRVSGLTRPVLRERSQKLLLEVKREARRARSNALVVEQILVNLVLNASEAAAGAGEIRLEAGLSPGRVRLTVTDEGPGIPAELCERIFEPFFTTKPSGTGIGLTTARDAARELGGDLVLEPSEVGARFALLLPLGGSVRPADRGGA